MYCVMQAADEPCTEWVQANVIPIIDLPKLPDRDKRPRCSAKNLANWIGIILKGDPDPVIVVDWPDDVRYFCEAVITGPGTMISVPSLKFEVHRVDAYPTTLPDAVQHNAFWDALALRYLLAPRASGYKGEHP